MKKLILFLSVIININGTPAVTFAISSGRLGDQLSYYSIAKKLSLKHNLPFYCKPFKYSDQLNISLLDRTYDDILFRHYRIVEIGSEILGNIDYNSDTLYVVTNKHWRTSASDFAWQGVPHDKPFLQELRKTIAPRNPISTVARPPDMVSVAVHVRIGEGYDSASTKKGCPEKFPPEQFYIDSIKRIKNIYSYKNLYFFIFTDAYDPKKVAQRFSELFPDPSMIFNSRDAANFDSFVLEDLFSMAEFDCLIRAVSGLSVTAQAIGNHAIVIYPGGEIFDHR